MKLSGAWRSRLSKASLKTESSNRCGDRQQRVEKDLAVSDGLESFCADFTELIEKQAKSFAKFWTLMQTLSAEWLGEEDAHFVGGHVWALKVGFESVTDAVLKQLGRALKTIRKANEDLKACSQHEAYEAWDKAWVEKEHYERKLKKLRAELTAQSQRGKQLSDDQMKQLQRNEAKTAQAQEAYEAFQAQAQAYAAAKKILRTALRDVVRAVTCGWFISSGATVCQALHCAEKADGGGQANQRTPEAAKAPSSSVLALEDDPRRSEAPQGGESEEYPPPPTWTLPSSMSSNPQAAVAGAMAAFDPSEPFQAAVGAEADDHEASGDEHSPTSRFSSDVAASPPLRNLEQVQWPGDSPGAFPADAFSSPSGTGWPSASPAGFPAPAAADWPAAAGGFSDAFSSGANWPQEARFAADPPLSLPSEAFPTVLIPSPSGLPQGHSATSPVAPVSASPRLAAGASQATPPAWYAEQQRRPSDPQAATGAPMQAAAAAAAGTGQLVADLAPSASSPWQAMMKAASNSESKTPLGYQAAAAAPDPWSGAAAAFAAPKSAGGPALDPWAAGASARPGAAAPAGAPVTSPWDAPQSASPSTPWASLATPAARPHPWGTGASPG
eukprot:TRINITY_DN14352_c0_g1_i1.p1 TRINITY_DN14352_c0_g1~~TRINITY_DN14352_c0_g1_i1.p1  ORF type:complete len:613 (+),score=137.37 TRINITY_DN14352_c0_g1_i1:115-1953(+)